MDAYRSLIKQTIKTYSSNPTLKKYFLSVFKKTFLNAPKNVHHLIPPIAQNLIKIMASVETNRIEVKKNIDLHTCYIKSPCKQLSDDGCHQKTFEEQAAARIFQFIQLYYLIYCKKIFTKKTFMSHNTFMEQANRHRPAVEIGKREKDEGVKLELLMVLPGNKLGTLL